MVGKLHFVECCNFVLVIVILQIVKVLESYEQMSRLWVSLGV